MALRVGFVHMNGAFLTLKTVLFCEMSVLNFFEVQKYILECRLLNFWPIFKNEG
jgi:hypothetical protein